MKFEKIIEWSSNFRRSIVLDSASGNLSKELIVLKIPLTVSSDNNSSEKIDNEKHSEIVRYFEDLFIKIKETSKNRKLKS